MAERSGATAGATAAATGDRTDAAGSSTILGDAFARIQRDIVGTDNLLWMTDSNALDEVVREQFLLSVRDATRSLGHALVLVPCEDRAAFWNDGIRAQLPAASRSRVRCATPETLALPLLSRTGLLIIDDAHVALQIHCRSGDVSETSDSRLARRRAADFAAGIARCLFACAEHGRVLAHAAAPSTPEAKSVLVPLLAQWLQCTRTYESSCSPAPSTDPARERVAVVPLPVPMPQMLDQWIDYDQHHLLSVLQQHSDVFPGTEQVLILCPTRRSAQRTVDHLGQRLGAANDGSAVPLLLHGLSTEAATRLKFAASLLQNDDLKRQALLGLARIDPPRDADASSRRRSAGGKAEAADQMLLLDLFLNGSLRIASATMDLRACAALAVAAAAVGAGAPNAAAAADADDGRGALWRRRKSPTAWLDTLLGELALRGRRVVVVLKTTAWTGFDGRLRTLSEAALRHLSIQVQHESWSAPLQTTLDAMARPDTVGAAGHRLVVITPYSHAERTYLSAMGRVYCGSRTFDPTAPSHRSGPAWRTTLVERAGADLIDRLLSEMHGAGGEITDVTAAAAWIRHTLHFQVLSRGIGQPPASTPAAAMMAQALLRQLRMAGCIVAAAADDQGVQPSLMGLAALKYDVSAMTLACFVREAYGHAGGSIWEAPTAPSVGVVPPTVRAPILFDAQRHSTRCRQAVECLYYACTAGSGRELRGAERLLQCAPHGKRLLGGSDAGNTGPAHMTTTRRVPFPLRYVPRERAAGAAAFTLTQLWLQYREPIDARRVAEHVLRIVRCIHAAVLTAATATGKEAAEYQHSPVGLLARWLETFVPPRGGVAVPSASTSAAPTCTAAEEVLLQWTR